MAEKIFGHFIVNSEGREVPMRYIGEQHVREDLGRILSFQDWITEGHGCMYGQKMVVTKNL
jgi:hypothetical protein